MARKTKEAGNPNQNALLDAVCTSAQQIWVAGLGAFARAQKEGTELFDKLVQEGGELARLTDRLAPQRGPLSGGTMSRLAGNMSKQASDSWDKLEKLFEVRVARALRSLGAPSHDDLGAVSQQVAEVLARLELIEAQAARPVRKTPAKAAKPVVKQAAKQAAKQAVKLAAKGAALKGAALKGGARTAVKRTARVTSH